MNQTVESSLPPVETTSTSELPPIIVVNYIDELKKFNDEYKKKEVSTIGNQNFDIGFVIGANVNLSCNNKCLNSDDTLFLSPHITDDHLSQKFKKAEENENCLNNKKINEIMCCDKRLKGKKASIFSLDYLFGSLFGGSKEELDKIDKHFDFFQGNPILYKINSDDKKEMCRWYFSKDMTKKICEGEVGEYNCEKNYTKQEDKDKCKIDCVTDLCKKTGYTLELDNDAYELCKAGFEHEYGISLDDCDECSKQENNDKYKNIKIGLIVIVAIVIVVLVSYKIFA